jgi:hypothetical protein
VWPPGEHRRLPRGGSRWSRKRFPPTGSRSTTSPWLSSEVCPPCRRIQMPPWSSMAYYVWTTRPPAWRPSPRFDLVPHPADQVLTGWVSQLPSPTRRRGWSPYVIPDVPPRSHQSAGDVLIDLTGCRIRCLPFGDGPRRQAKAADTGQFQTAAMTCWAQDFGRFSFFGTGAVLEFPDFCLNSLFAAARGPLRPRRSSGISGLGGVGPKPQSTGTRITEC